MGGATLLLLFSGGDTQHAAPDADVTAGSWTTHTGATTGLFEQINEPSPDDGDFIKSSDLASGSDTAEVGMADLSDPSSAADHSVQYRFRKQGNAVMDFTVRLMDGATEIAAWTHNGVTTDWTDATQTLTTLQADAITDYADLRLRFTAAVAA